MSSCKVCQDSTSLITINQNKVQKEILRQKGVHSSQYMQNIASLNNTINNTNVGRKLNSYDRYLLKKKGNVLSQQGKKISNAVKGNKTKSLQVSSYFNNNCNCINPSNIKPNCN